MLRAGPRNWLPRSGTSASSSLHSSTRPTCLTACLSEVCPRPRSGACTTRILNPDNVTRRRAFSRASLCRNSISPLTPTPERGGRRKGETPQGGVARRGRSAASAAYPRKSTRMTTFCAMTGRPLGSRVTWAKIQARTAVSTANRSPGSGDRLRLKRIVGATIGSSRVPSNASSACAPDSPSLRSGGFGGGRGRKSYQKGLSAPAGPRDISRTPETVGAAAPFDDDVLGARSQAG